MEGETAAALRWTLYQNSPVTSFGYCKVFPKHALGVGSLEKWHQVKQVTVNTQPKAATSNFHFFSVNLFQSQQQHKMQQLGQQVAEEKRNKF